MVGADGGRMRSPTPTNRSRRGRRFRRLLPAVVAAATLAATVPAAAPADAHAGPTRSSGPPNRVALVERVQTTASSPAATASGRLT